MYFKLLLLTLGILLFAVAALSVNIIFKKDGKFSGGSCNSSPGLKKSAAGCGCGTNSCHN